MNILQYLGQQIQNLFPRNRHGQERAQWFLLALQAILIPITPSRTSSLLRTIRKAFDWDIQQGRFYTFMASPKLPWDTLWELLWRAIPEPLTDGRLLLALDDSINPKTGKKIFACEHTFDHAAKINQTSYPWAQTLVSVGLLRIIHGRWACIPLAFSFYLREITVEKLKKENPKPDGKHLIFKNKYQQAVGHIARIATAFTDVPLLIIADSWFGNNGVWDPLQSSLGKRANILSRLRSNNLIYATASEPEKRTPGRPRKYGKQLGNASTLAKQLKQDAKTYKIHLYGKMRNVNASSSIVMLKTLRACVRVVWVYRKTQWVALFTTDLGLSIEQIIEYYGARWKIEAGFREIKQEIGSSQTQAREPDAVSNHLHFCMAATTITWIYGAHQIKAPQRLYATRERTQYTFADLRRVLARDFAEEGFGAKCPSSGKSQRNPIVAILLDLAA